MVNFSYFGRVGPSPWSYTGSSGRLSSEPLTVEDYNHRLAPGRVPESLGLSDDDYVDSSIEFSFVGTGIELEGIIESNGSSDKFVKLSLWYSNMGMGGETPNFWYELPGNDTGDILFTRKLATAPRAYIGRVSVPRTVDFTFKAMWYSIPVRSQA